MLAIYWREVTPPPYPSYLFWIPGAPISPPKILRDPGGFTSIGWLPGVGVFQKVSRAKGTQWAEPRREGLLRLGVGVEQALGSMPGSRDQGQYLINPEMPGCSAPPKRYNLFLQGCCAAG